MQRTDTHRPSTINPAEYEYVGSFVLNPPVDPDGNPMVDDDMSPYFAPYGDDRTYYDLLAPNYSLGRPREDVGQCDHCGAYINYHAVYCHAPTGEHIIVGHDCADNTLGWSDRRSLDLARQKRATEAARKNAAEEKQRRENIENTRRLFPDAVALLETYEGSNSFIQDVAGRFTRFGTTKRIEGGDHGAQSKVMAAVLKAHQRDLDREAEQADAADVREGRYEIEGVVLSTKLQESDYGSTWKMLVKQDDGARVWGSIPAEIDADKGDRVKFTARVKQSPRDTKFGFFSRPTKATIIEEETA